MRKLNLDALISREDFEVLIDSSASSSRQTLQITDLERDSFFYPVLRKPDFQRETSDWEAEKVCDFIRCFLDGDLIPAIILWNSGANTFVIDGAHRLSALIAWVQSDYGDGFLSRSFFEQQIQPEQIKAAEQARQLIDRKLGSYEAFRSAILNPEKAQPEMRDRARRLATLALQLQWVSGDSGKAEASFFKINQQATPIDKTEFRLLKARHKPNALAARAIIRAGTGHKYWSKFADDRQKEIQATAREINALLFVPPLDTPIKTLDLPLAGRGYSASTLQLILELVNIANDVRSDTDLKDDQDGQMTVDYLKNTRKICYRMAGQHASSLGLHPVVYFYSDAGRYQQTAFLAVVALIKEFESRNYFKTFARLRQTFEDFLLRHKKLPNQVTLKWGSGTKGFRSLRDLYLKILELMDAGHDERQIQDLLNKDATFSFLVFNVPPLATEKKDFSTEVKSAVFIRDALKTPLRCALCGGFMHVKSISVDHIERKQNGGLGNEENAQLTHPFCNTTLKG